MRDICLKYRITDEEYLELHKQFSRLCWKAAHELKRKNSRNNYTDDAEDIYQELVAAMLRAGSYYKRQTYIEKCLALAEEHANDPFLKYVVTSLTDLWKNRTRHGANRQKFGPFQEQILERIVRKVVPKDGRPNKKDSLLIDAKFRRYCKAIVWNGLKSMGKRITREKPIRSGQVSLSEYDYLGQSL
jgi:hypothetical protein